VKTRLPILVVVASLLTIGLIVDRSDQHDRERDALSAATATTLDPTAVLPIAGAPSALGSSWYCAGGTAQAKGVADHTVVIANPTDRDAQGTLTVFPGVVQPKPPGAAEGEASSSSSSSTTSTTAKPVHIPKPVAKAFTIGPYRRVSFRLGDVVKAPLASALVEAQGGTITVEHQVIGEDGRDAAPCASSPSSEWHFAWGVTRRDAREMLVFFNPFPDDATIDVFFSTEQGAREPVRFHGFVVPARSVIGVDVGDDVTYRERVSASVRARTGRVIVDRIQSYDGSQGAQGLTVTLGTPQPAESWMYPDGAIGSGIIERYVIYNPGTEPAEAELQLSLEDPAKNGTPEPFEITVGPRGTKVLTINDDKRIPKNVAHSGIVRSLNGVPVVAERVLFAVEPAKRHGISTTPGSPLGAEAWVFAVGSANDTNDEYLTILNLADKPARVSVTALANGQRLAVADLQDVEIPASARLSIRVGEHVQRNDLALVVESNEPIVAERSLYRVSGVGMSAAIGIPLRIGLFVPPPFKAG
jgi:hypothetical protein